MSYRFVRCQNTIGWDWYLESGDCSSWVSQPTKEIIESLEAENAKLREERDRLLMNANPTANELRRVRAAWKKDRAENAKLRQLVIAQCECVKHDDCSECVHYSKPKCTFPFKTMYRELKLEVD